MRGSLVLGGERPLVLVGPGTRLSGLAAVSSPLNARGPDPGVPRSMAIRAAARRPQKCDGWDSAVSGIMPRRAYSPSEVSMATTQRRRAAQTPGSGRSARALSYAAENYLLSLAILHEDGIAPHVGQLASYLRHIPLEEGLGTTMASVSGMVHRMAREGLVEVNRSKEVELTPEGELIARDVVRRHRLAERLLVDVLDVPIERAEIEAHRLEHAISPALLKRIEEKLGYPKTCPYGRPIYGVGEERLRKDNPGTLRLSETEAGGIYTIVQIPDEDFPLLRYMVENRVLPGQPIEVVDNAPYRGVVDLRREGVPVSIGVDVAQRIRVKPRER